MRYFASDLLGQTKHLFQLNFKRTLPCKCLILESFTFSRLVSCLTHCPVKSSLGHLCFILGKSKRPAGIINAGAEKMTTGSSSGANRC